MARDVILNDPLEQYLREVNRHPLLTKEQEYSLARRFRDTGDAAAAHALVTSNLRFVVKIAYQFQNYDIKLTDLVQEGNIGLMKAVRKFNPDRGYRLISYAVWWIKAYIQNYIIQSWSLVRVGPVSQQRRVLFGRRDQPVLEVEESEAETAAGPEGEEARRGAASGGESEEVAADVVAETFLVAAEATGALAGLRRPAAPTAEEVEQWRRAAQAARRDMSLDGKVGEEGRLTLGETLASPRPTAEEEYGSAEVTTLVAERLAGLHGELNDKELAILEGRLLADEALTLQEVGDAFGISRERARQIEANLKRKIARALEGLRPAPLLPPPEG